MKKIALTICIASLCLASLAWAQAEVNETNALGLGWTACSSANPVGAADVAFLCAAEPASACRVFRLMPTFVSSITDNAFAGSTITIDVLIGSNPVVGQWWSGMQAAGCRPPAVVNPGNITAASLPVVGACRNTYPAGSGTLPGLSFVPNVGTNNPQPNRIRISSANSVNPAPTITIGERTYAMQLEFKTEGTLADCDPTIDPTPVCVDGCTTAACFVLNDVSLYMEVGSNDPNPDIVHYSHDGGATRNWCTYQGGTGGNCPGATPSRPTTWGAIKSLYR